MKKRSTEILQGLIKENAKKYSISKLAKDYKVTQRTLRNDLAEINDFLRDINQTEIFFDEDGILEIGPDFDSEQVEQRLYEMDIYIYKLSPEERRMFILVSLLQNKGYTKMQKLAEELYVSRITILSDFEFIKEYLDGFGIQIISDTGKGIMIQCSKEKKIELLIEMFREIAINIKNDGFFQRLVLKRLQVRYSFSEIFTYLQEYTNLNNIVFIDDVFYDIVIYLFAEFNLMPDADGQDKEIDSGTKLRGMDYMMVYVGYMIDFNITERMVKRFGEYLEKNHLTSFVKTIDEIELYKVITHFLAEIDREMNLDLTTDSMLIDSLLLHIKSMKDWGGYEVELPYENNMEIDYEMLEDVVGKHVDILERFLSYELSANMKKSIVIHICVALIRNRRYAAKLSVAIVCPGSMATGKYLEAQIKNYFDFKVIGVIAASQVLRKLEESEPVDFIISTVPIRTDQYKVLTVRPFLTMEDMNKIQKTSFECQKRKPFVYGRGKQSLMDNLQNMMENQGFSYGLRQKIEKIIDEYEEDDKVYHKSAISELLKREFILTDNSDMDWRSGMKKAASLLEEQNYIGPEYIQESIKHVEEYGDYIIIGDGIALAHAGKEYGVYEDGLSLLVSEPGIVFSDGETRVHLLFCFASKGEKEYLELLQEIVAIGKIEGKMHALLNMQEDKIYEALSTSAVS